MSDSSVRLDKWLWAARFYKTRSLAKAAIEGGKVHYDRARCKASRIVEPGAIIQLRQGWDEKTIEVLALSEQRRGAPEAQLLYRETTESMEKRQQQAAMRKLGSAQARPMQRPSKKERRQIMRFKNIHDN